MVRIRSKKIKLFIRILLILVILVISSVGYYYSFMDPYRAIVKNPETSMSLDQSINRKQALDDLMYLTNYLKDYHPAYLDGSDYLSKAVHNQYKTELQSIGDSVTVLELWQAAGRIASKLHDGHTKVWYNNSSDNYYISDFTQILEYGNPININGISTETIFENIKSRYSFETEAYAESKFYDSIIFSKTQLAYCGIDTSEGVTFTYQTESGTKEYHYDFVALDDVIGYEKVEDPRWVYFKIDSENNLAVFTLLECTYNDEYSSVLADFFNQVKENNITNIAVDLRGNGGGNSWVANEFLQYINVDEYDSWDNAVRLGWYLHKNTNNVYKNEKKKVVFDGDLYVLTNNYTYSSAMDFAMLIGDNDLGLIVGEPSGNMPNSYGDILTFQMPNSKLCFSVSYKKWYRVDKSKADEALLPDYEVDADKALDKVYELIRKK